MLRPRRLPRARADISEIWLYIASDNISAADKLLDRFDAAVAMLSEHPYSGKARSTLGQGIRSHAIEAYVIFYRPTEIELEIVRVLNAARDVNPEVIAANH